MTEVERLGVIGMGVVGNAVYEGMKHAYPIMVYDRFKRFNDGIESIVKYVDGPIFLAVPTPMNSDGTPNTSIVESVISEISESATTQNLQRKPIVVIKSTVAPGTTERLNNKYEAVDVIFNPEFLTEARPVEDFKNQDRIILGGIGRPVTVTAAVYNKAYPNVPIIKAQAGVAEMVKYVTNCFLASKVSFANEIHQICQALGVDYDKVVEYAQYDQRLGKSHWLVPGPDGHFGFGLTCFPKDLNALISVAKELGVDPKVMTAVWEKNLEVRPERDWEEMKGRAIT
jgi:UDPglucose 6-dehydrogenase